MNVVLIVNLIWRANNEAKPDNQSDSEGETEEGDYTVYECPGLAPVRKFHSKLESIKKLKIN